MKSINLKYLIQQGSRKKIEEAVRANISYSNGDVEYIASFKNGYLQLIPRTSEDLDTVNNIKMSISTGDPDSEFLNLTQAQLEKMTRLKFSEPKSTGNSTFMFYIDEDYILGLLR